MNKRALKKEHILWSGFEVLRTQGYNGTGVKDIVDAAGVPKGSFYNYFESKESFAVDALEAAAHKALEFNRAMLSAPGKTPMQRLTDYFEYRTEEASNDEFRVGCFFGNMCQEMADSSDAIRDKVQIILKQHTRLIQDMLDQAKDAGEINPVNDTEVSAEFIMNAWEGTLMRMKASKSREPLDAFLKLLPQIAN